MNFERLINKYLDGTISSKELQQLQQLLEAPEQMAALRQTLEIRSHIHDDLLRLNPPSPLSERTRASVAAQFAALQTTAEPIPAAPILYSEPKRRRAMLPFRVAAGALVAVWLTTMLALTPTLLWENEGNGRLSQAVQSPPATQQEVGISRTRSSFRTAVRKGTAVRQQIAATVITPANVASAPVETTVVISDSTTSEAAQQALPTLADISLLKTAPPSGLPNNNSGSNDGRIVMEAHGIDTPPVATPPTPGNRLFAVGVTLGSGNVDKLSTPNALMQNTYYFAFSINKETRVGVEMGASTFYQPTASGSSGSDGFAKESVGDPELGGKGPTGPRLTTPIPEATTSDKQNPEQSVTYGAVFYDRRFPVSRSIDICGRVTVGAADNALLGNLRAYLAYSPSSNVTLTAGIGGAGLYNITDTHGANSVNYGVYYGIETGF